MSNHPTPYQPDPDQLRSERAYYQLIHILYTYLPPPLDDTPEALTARNEAALARVADMAPVNADEADIAAHCVATRAQAGDVLRLIRANAGDTMLVMKLNAQFMLMERTAVAIRNQLLRMQAARIKREANPKAADSDALTRHVATRQMEQALERGALAATVAAANRAPAAADTSQPPPVPAQVAPEAALPPPLAPAATRSPRHRPRIMVEANAPPRDLAAEAEHYAAVYPDRAREIRRCGGLPPNCSFGPPDDELVQELVTSPRPALCALDLLAAAAE